MNLAEAKESIEICLKADLPIFLEGSFGIGKSDLIKSIADKYQLELVDLRLSQCDITDLNGLPKFENGKASFQPFDVFPLEGTPVPKGKKGWLLFLDELNAAERSIQAAAYKLILDRMVGNHKLHKNLRIVAAGNKLTDNAVVNELSNALRTRLVNITVNPDFDTWLQWAVRNNIDARITAYLMSKPTSLFNYVPEKEASTFACPRTWGMLSKVISPLKDLEKYGELINGIVGTVAGEEFKTFTKYHHLLPNITDIFNGTAVPKKDEDIGVIYQTLGEVIANINRITMDSQFVNVCEYLKAFSSDYLVIFMQKVRLIDSTISLKFPSFIKYAGKVVREDNAYDPNSR